MYHKFEVEQLVRAVSASTRLHWRRLGFASRADYIVWRWRRGLRAGHELSWSEKFSELGTLYLEFEAEREIERYKAAPEAFIRGVCSGRIQHWSLHDEALAPTAEAIQFSGLDRAELSALADFLGVLARKNAPFVFSSKRESGRGPTVRNLILMNDYRPYWVRRPEDWTFNSADPDKGLRSLARHLFDRFDDVPAFLGAAWLRTDPGSARYRDWFVHLGRGGSLKEVDMPLALTRRMRHLLSGALEGWTIEQALRWAQAMGLDLPEPMAWAVAGSRLGRGLDDDHFWVSFLTWLRDTPGVEPAAVGPLVDYIYAQKFDPVILQVEGGERELQPPPHPGFSMRGRSFEGLGRAMTLWHQSLNSRRRTFLQFPKPALDQHTFEVTVEEGTLVWTARPLRNTVELVREAQEMSHCVANYNERCASGVYSVWSLSRQGSGKADCRLTLMADRNGGLAEVRGWANRSLTDMETEAVRLFLRELRQATLPTAANDLS